MMCGQVNLLNSAIQDAGPEFISVVPAAGDKRCRRGNVLGSKTRQFIASLMCLHQLTMP